MRTSPAAGTAVDAPLRTRHHVNIADLPCRHDGGRIGEEHLLTDELDQLGWFTFAEHLRPTAPRVHVLAAPPHPTVAYLVYEAVVGARQFCWG